MGYGYDYPAGKIINATAAHTGRFGKIVALNDSVINRLVAENVTGDLTALNVSATAEVCGVITRVKLDSGSMIAYSL